MAAKQKDVFERRPTHELFYISEKKFMDITHKLIDASKKMSNINDFINYIDNTFTDLRERDYAFFLAGRMIQENETAAKILTAMHG